jgi:hypothetical protein
MKAAAISLVLLLGLRYAGIWTGPWWVVLLPLAVRGALDAWGFIRTSVLPLLTDD